MQSMRQIPIHKVEWGCNNLRKSADIFLWIGGDGGMGGGKPWQENDLRDWEKNSWSCTNLRAECHSCRLISHKLHGRTTSTKKHGQVDVFLFIGGLECIHFSSRYIYKFDILSSSSTWSIPAEIFFTNIKRTNRVFNLKT